MNTCPEPGCRFCLENDLLVDRPLLVLQHLFILGSIEEHRPHQAMIVPHRHIETPFDLNAQEWSEISEALAFVKASFDKGRADGFTVGWNVGAAAGQDVFHAHLHVIARFKGDPSEGLGIHALFRTGI
ncbi:HIT family protein [Sagittula sp. SSi028]|uniref:HIT family protein n=1 Tax=Sagittula sp. SSi028 TaxID=3400636 RepID=UPI003AF623DD